MNWYCIHARPKREHQAIEQITSQLGYEVYFPKLKRKKTIRRVRREVTEPLFPRYFFCRFDLSTGYRAIRYTHDVLDIVSFGSSPAIVDDSLVDDLRKWTSEAGETIQVGPAFALGEQVSISAGPMQGLQAMIVEDKPEEDRVAVLLWILGCGARAMVPRTQIAKIA